MSTPLQIRHTFSDKHAQLVLGADHYAPTFVPMTPAATAGYIGAPVAITPRIPVITGNAATLLLEDLQMASPMVRQQLAKWVDESKVELLKVSDGTAITGDDLRAM